MTAITDSGYILSYKCARVREPRSVLVILFILCFGVSVAVPAEDVPETAYDESETLPYEGTPQFLFLAPQASARMAKAELSCGVQPT